MEIEQKLCVLEKIAAALNPLKISWAVGASALLYFKGIVDNFDDIDILVAEFDCSAARAALGGLGALQPPISNEKYRSACFCSYQIDGVMIDLIAGFTILADSAEHYFPLEGADIAEIIPVKSEAVPLHSLARWRDYYELMGRTQKVDLLDSYFRAHSGLSEA